MYASKQFAHWMSIKSWHTHIIVQQAKKEENSLSVAAGFEPAREFPNGFQVHRLNHSAKQPRKNVLEFNEYKSFLHFV